MRLRTWQKGLLALVFVGCLAWLSVFGQSAPSIPSKPELAKTVLTAAGIPSQYDRYLMNSIEMVTLPSADAKSLNWLHQILVREAGWQKIEAQFVTSLDANFSQAELQELESLLQQPLLKKLLQVDAKTYADVAPTRRKSFFAVWDNYNQGKYGTMPTGNSK